MHIKLQWPQTLMAKDRTPELTEVNIHGKMPPDIHCREFTKGGLVKGGFAIYAFPLCTCNGLGSVFHAQIENMPNC